MVKESSPRQRVRAMASRVFKALVAGLFSPRSCRSTRSHPPQTPQSEVLSARGSDDSSEPLPSEAGTGSVYWGQLPDGSQIAVKRLNSSNMKVDRHFGMEAEKLGRMQHKNVLKLRGYCIESHERILVYDFMPNSSLLAHLHGAFAYETHLAWKQRANIALGCAQGLAYLHRSGMIHGNIKASNILLSGTFDPLYADYGVSSLMKRRVIKSKSALGYTAPECCNGEDATKQADVFSLGILLLELISGRRPMEKLEFSMRQHIVEWAEPLILDNRLELLLDPKLGGEHEADELKRLVFVATLCAQTKPDKRPPMTRVVELLRSS